MRVSPIPIEREREGSLGLQARRPTGPGSRKLGACELRGIIRVRKISQSWKFSGDIALWSTWPGAVFDCRTAVSS